MTTPWLQLDSRPVCLECHATGRIQQRRNGRWMTCVTCIRDRRIPEGEMRDLFLRDRVPARHDMGEPVA